MQYRGTGSDASTVSGAAVEQMLCESIDGMVVLDGYRRIVSASPGCERITGYPVSELVGAESHEATGGQGGSLAAALRHGLPALNNEVSSDQRRVQIRHRDGYPVWVEATFLPMRNMSGEIHCVVSLIREIERTPDDGEPGNRSGLESGNNGAHDSRAEGEHERGNALDHVLHTVERREILSALRQANGQRSRAARELGISRSRLYRRMEALGIDPREDV